MPSPFPGMDPYLEDPVGWGGVHLGLIVAVQAELNRVLPDGYVARIDEYVWVRDTDDDDPPEQRKPDVFVPSSGATRAGGVAVARPGTAPTVRGRLPKGEKQKNRVVRITTARGRQVLTVLEILSPKNKIGSEGRAAYTQKRREYLASVNLVEIDLLRAGGRFPMARPAPPPADYYVFSCRRNEYPNTDVWAFTVRDRLPIIPVPFAADHPDALLDLRATLNRVYAEGRYAELTDYTVPPVPPLRAGDAEWAAELLKKHTRRKK